VDRWSKFAAANQLPSDDGSEVAVPKRAAVEQHSAAACRDHERSCRAVVIILFASFARMLRKVGPNQALIRYGLGGTHIVHGGAQLVLPLIHSAQELSLELMSFDVAPQQISTRTGRRRHRRGGAQLKIKNDPNRFAPRVSKFSQAPQQRESLIDSSWKVHLRGIIGQLTVEQIDEAAEMVADRMRGNVAEDVARWGRGRVIHDQGSAETRINTSRTWVVRTSRASSATRHRCVGSERDTADEAAGTCEKRVARARKQQRVLAEDAVEAKQAEAQKDLAL
jgi:flotillin